MATISPSELIKEKAFNLGFSACGIACARKLEEEEERLKTYLSNNYNGKMDYLANHFDKRIDPTLLVPSAKSVIVVLLNYFPENMQQGVQVPVISKYAYGKDYHFVMKRKLQQLFDFISTEIAPVEGRIFTDSAPVLERAWAVQAGLGWIGKNGLLLNKTLGSFFFIGELIIDFKLDYDQPLEKEYCGNCNQCLSACPTKALLKPYILDARRCISYLTIELKEDIPDCYKPMLVNRVFGCDICQDVCPWNQRIKPHNEPDFMPSEQFLYRTTEQWHNLTKADFDSDFSQSAIKRTGFEKFKRNIFNIISSQE